MALKEQTTPVSLEPCKKALTAVPHHHPDTPSLGSLCFQSQCFRKVCGNFRCLLRSERRYTPKADGAAIAPHPHQGWGATVTASTQEHWARMWGSKSESSRSIAVSSRVKPGICSGSGRGRQETRCRPSCCTAAAWDQLYWFNNPSNNYIDLTYFTSFLLCQEQHVAMSQQCHAPADVHVFTEHVVQRSVKAHSSEQKGLQELSKDSSRELHAGRFNGFTMLFSHSGES